MTVLRAHGIDVHLPAGWEGRIFRRATVGGDQPHPVVHLATFPLPAKVADFGGGAVEQMGPNDLFAVLFEYGPESSDTALFAHQGLPRCLQPEHFRTTVLRRGLGGQAGTQWFFREAGRPFTLYAVLGSFAGRQHHVPRLNAVLEGVSVASSSTSSVPASAQSTDEQVSAP